MVNGKPEINDLRSSKNLKSSNQEKVEIFKRKTNNDVLESNTNTIKQNTIPDMRHQFRMIAGEDHKTLKY